MIEEKFARGNSFLHKRDPRCKIVVACFFALTVAVLDSFIALSLALIVAFALLLLAKLPFIDVGKKVLLINGFTLFLWIMLPLTYGGEERLHLYIFDLSRQGVSIAAMITMKTNIMITALIALFSTSTIAELGHSLDRLHLPKKLCFILLYSYRYTFVIYQEYTRLLRAAKMRCFAPGTNLHTYKTYGYLFGMTLVKSYNRSNRVYQAMLLRGFNGSLVSLHRFRFTTVDAVFSLVVAFLTIAIAITNTKV